MGSLKIGRGTEEDVKVGPLIDQDAVDKVEELVADARGKGAKVVVGRQRRRRPRLLLRAHGARPTCPADARVLEEEIFGPVAPIAGFSSPRTRRSARPTTPSTAWSPTSSRSDFKRAIRVIEGLETGMVGLNQGMVSNAAAPFGGWKWSGIGREGGFEGIEEYLETKYVAVNMD